MTLVEFLAARLDEDERITRRSDADPTEPPLEDQRQYGRLVISTARVLAEVEAKRRMLALADEWDRRGREAEGYINRAHAIEIHEVMAEARWYPERAAELRSHVSVVYAGHPDYDPAWRP